MAEWKLSRPKFFEQFQSAPGKSGTHPSKNQNLVYIWNDVLYYWRASTQTIIKASSSEVWRSDDVDASYEEWSLSRSIPFPVTHMSVRKASKEVILLWGPAGAAVVTWPLLKKQKGVANAVIIAEKTYLDNPGLKILQAKWHPTERHNIVNILNNDDYIRSYSIEEPSVVCSHMCAGGLNSNSVPFRFNASSSESPVDFDFGPHLPNEGYWTIFILKSSGVLSYALMKLIGSTPRSIWEDEKIVPIDGEYEDVFEMPAALSVSKNFPLLITVGGLGGSLYHSVLLPLDTDTSDSLDLEENLVSGETVLFVKEVVVLEEDMQLSYLELIPDPLCYYRYACVHQEGVHLITINFVPYMTKLLSAGEAGDDGFSIDGSATCRHVLCSKGNEQKNDFITVAFSDSVPQKLVSLSRLGENFVYDVTKYAELKLSEDDDSDKGKNERKLNPIALNALENVKSLLAKTTTQPYLSCPSDLSPEKQSALILDAIRTLQEEYVSRQQEAMKFLSVALRNLKDRVEEMRNPIQSLERAQPAIRAKAEELAEKYEDQNEAQTRLLKRFQAHVFRYHRSLPVMSDEERKWQKKFREMEVVLPQIKEQILGLKAMVAERQREESSVIDDGSGSPRGKISAIELLEIKREIIDHQKILSELTQSFQEVGGNAIL